MTAANTTMCGAHRPGYEHGPAWGRRRLPCVLAPEHEGPHTNAMHDEWTETDVPNHPHAERDAGRHHRPFVPAKPAPAVPRTRDADRLANAFTVALVSPGPDAVRALRRADRLFTKLDQEVKRGAVPHGWRVLPNGNGDAVTTTYDVLSSALRADPEEDAGTALAVARELWSILDAAMCAGSVLPEPWHKTTPRS